MSYFNEINGYLSSLKESQANEASMSNEMANKKAQSIEDKFSSINSSIESAGGIMVAGAEGWFKGRKILEKLGKAGKGKTGGEAGTTGTDITTPQTKLPNGSTQTKDATTGDKPPSVADNDLTDAGFNTSIDTSATTGGRISVPKQGLKRNAPNTNDDNNPAPEADAATSTADAGGAGGGGIGAPLTDAKPLAQSAMSADDISSLQAGLSRTLAARGFPTPLAAPAQTSNQIGSLGKQVAAQRQPPAAAAEDAITPVRPPAAKPALDLQKPTNGSTEGGGGSGGGAGGETPSSTLKSSMPDGDLSVSGDIDGITNSLTSTLKSKASNLLKTGADTLGVDSEAVMGAANVALDGIPIIGEIVGIGTMIAGLARDIGDKGNINRKAAAASADEVSSARGAVDTGQVASTGMTTAGSYIA